MPELARLVREGHRGVLETEHPPLSPLLWTTMMTGTGPLEHGVLDFVRFHPRTGEREPIGSDERARPAIWNMATWGGKKVGVFGLWATYPAEAVDGVLGLGPPVRLPQPRGPPARRRGVPAERQAWATETLRRAGAAVDAAELARFLPWLTAADYAARVETEKAGARPYDDPVSALRRILIETRRLRRALPRVRRRVASRSRHPLSAGHRQHRPPVRSLRGAAPARRLGRGLRALPRGARALLPVARRSARPATARWRRATAPLSSSLPITASCGRRADRPRSRASTSRPPPSGIAKRASICCGVSGRKRWPPIPTSCGQRPLRSHGGIRQVCATLLALTGLPPGQGVTGPPLAPIAALAPAAG